jgi:CubicO group peptidase (beta-lactamase class C family)
MRVPSSAQTHIDALVDQGQLAGAVALAWRDGKVAAEVVSGWRDIATKAPMRTDTLFRIASLTKPVTAVAAMMLLEEGRIRLDDPITDIAPEFRSMRVLLHPDGELDDTVQAERPITIEDLLTHRAGFTYGSFHSGPLKGAYRDALGPDIDSHRSPDDWLANLASLPLIDQPGRAFHYGNSTDVLGFLIARLENAPLEVVLQRRIFAPLGMSDTRFHPIESQRHRCATMYGFGDDGHLETRDRHPLAEPAFLPRRPADMRFVSGSSGLWSSAEDYLKFARLFLSDGAVDGVRLLRPETLRLMTTNKLSPDQIAAATMLGFPAFSGQGFGLGVAVVLDTEKASVSVCRGGIGTVGWPGAYGGWWQADPTSETALVFLAHNALDFEKLERGLGLGVYAAIAAFHKAESGDLNM